MKLRKDTEEITTHMDVRYFLVFLFFLVSCLPESQVGRGNLASTGSNTPSGNTTGGTNSPATVNWNYLGTTGLSITVYASNLNNAYLIGLPVENYLNVSQSGAFVNFTNQDYCLVSDYSLGGLPLQLRTRIVPVSYYDFTAKRTIRVLRVDFNDITNSTNFCSSSLMVLNSSGNYVIDTTTPPSPKYDPRLICPTCTNILKASKVRIFKRNTDLYEVPVTSLNINSITLQLDPNNNTSGGARTCTNSECKSRGFNCCLDNQCVNDGATRPSASSLYSSQWQMAEQERLSNPRAYLNYPHLYYICGTTVPSNGGSTGGSSGSGSFDPAFQQLVKDYKCMVHIKSQSSMTPFHNEILNRTPPYTTTTDCLTASVDSTQTMFYQNVMKRLYSTCGCAKTELSDMINSCPAYEYKVALTDSLGEPIKIDCDTPPAVTPIPTQRSVSVNSRSAPHRFFDSTGVERDILSSSGSYTQEGDTFSYLDSGKVLPSQSDFSMNAILGQMSVTLDQALPARTLEVELDQVYLISTTSGYYTPCPSCGRDSWISSFSAYPSSSSGVGLQAIGHTTERDSLFTNVTAGNYEDTIFGRACWIPPTMIPYSHYPYSTVKAQRENRLKTQAALWVNGYQRDWYGFNKGALIGSFDGVTWFAIGKGRIVKSTSKKLFLAINAPFADLASPTLHSVNVQAYDGHTMAAQLDYDPQYHLTHPYQNEAGNCQANHMCSTDTDCITRLGWEYMCADVRDLKTQWPTFDINAQENPNETSLLTFDQILQQKVIPGSNSKRCVYRGSGAACLNNSSAVSDLNTRKLLTCAPNFYCANISTSTSFNSKVARFGAKLEDIPVTQNHRFGKDANVLGRPLHYLGDTNSIPSNSRQTVISSLKEINSNASTNSGLCLPGKALPTSANQVSISNQYNQHASADNSKRADFINQIASCNSGLFTAYRHSSCPIIDSEGNYEMFLSTIPSNQHIRASNQNACGLESLHTTASLTGMSTDTLLLYSPFRAIEAKTLTSQTIIEPTLVRDACLRRAGQVCHTELDCSPNKFHADFVDSFNLSFFGNEAERSYHREYLICGQEAPNPSLSDTDSLRSFRMNQNRCCREIGKDLTTYSTDTPRSTTSGDFESVSSALKSTLTPGVAPNDPKRYSRLATVENLTSTERPALTGNHNRNAGGVLTAPTNLTTINQWKTLNEANSESCCGGGWIRKFSDGSTNWGRRDRLYIDVSSFRCLNSRNVILTNPSDLASQYGTAAEVQKWINQDYGDYCKDNSNTNGACAQYSFSEQLNTSDVYMESPPTTDPYDSTIEINTINPSYSSSNLDNYFMPRSADFDSRVIVDRESTSKRENVIMKIPSFVPKSEFDDKIGTATPPTIIMSNSNGSINILCSHKPSLNITTPTSTDNPTLGADPCGYKFNTTNRTLTVYPHSTYFINSKAGVRIIIPVAGNSVAGVDRWKPGNTAYYLNRLGKLELSGIPQISYHAIRCSDNFNRVVPGIYKSEINLFTDFSNNSFSFTLGGERYTTHHGLQSEPVFSSHEFKCCTPLGKTTNDTNKCCSGYGITQDQSNSKFTCALPSGTNLMVYFNRFVSNEGIGSERPGGGLLSSDFYTQSGEPILGTAVNNKIRALGNAYCESGRVRQGGAFGLFEPEPQGSETNLTGRIYGIVDSSRDNGTTANAGQTSTTGHNTFMDGFRWNHHLYCDD